MTDSYVTVIEYEAYCTERGLSLTHPHDTVLAKGLVASEWLDARFRDMFPGRKTNGRSQEREWPRTGASDEEGYAIDSLTVPVEVKHAAYEALRREAATPGILSKDYTPNKYQRASVSGAVSVDYTNFNGAGETQIQLQIVYDILSRILDFDDYNLLSGEACR